jgi:hypothetical protein
MVNAFKFLIAVFRNFFYWKENCEKYLLLLAIKLRKNIVKENRNAHHLLATFWGHPEVLVGSTFSLFRTFRKPYRMIIYES